MTSLREGNVMWHFDEAWGADHYDRWAFYRKQFQICAGGGTKAVDIVAFDPGTGTLWLIEAKDYVRNQRHHDKGPIALEIAEKARDTLAGLLAAAANASNGDEQALARQTASARKLRVVLHLDLPSRRQGVFSQVLDPAKVLQGLRSSVRAIDQHPAVVSCDRSDRVPWTTEWSPQREAT